MNFGFENAALRFRHHENPVPAQDQYSTLPAVERIAAHVELSRTQPLDILVLAEPYAGVDASEYPWRIAAVAQHLRGGVIVGSDLHIPDEVVHQVLDHIQHYFFGKPFRVFPFESWKESDGFLIFGYVMSEAAYRDLRCDLDVKELEKELAWGREQIIKRKAEDMKGLIDEEKYIQVREGYLERHDTVFEVLPHKQGTETMVRYREGRVIDPERAAAKVRLIEDGAQLKIPHRRLVMLREVWAERFPREVARLEKQKQMDLERAAKQQASVAQPLQLAAGDTILVRDRAVVVDVKQPRLLQSVPPPAPSTPSTLDDFDAWLEMGKKFLDDFDATCTELNKRIQKTEEEIVSIKDGYGKQISDLEDQIEELRELMNDEVRMQVEEADTLRGKIADLERRHQMLKPLLAGK